MLKVNFTLEQATKARNVSRGKLFSLTSALDGVVGQRHAPAGLPSGKRSCTHRIGGLVVPRPGLDECGKFHPLTGFEPRTVQPVAGRFTD